MHKTLTWQGAFLSFFLCYSCAWAESLCNSLFEKIHTFQSGQRVIYEDVLLADFNENLKTLGTGNRRLITAQEGEFLGLDWNRPHRLELAEAVPQRPEHVEPGVLWLPRNQGVVIEQSSPKINRERTEDLFQSLSARGDRFVWAYDYNMLHRLGIRKDPKDAYAKVPIHEYVKDYLNSLQFREGLNQEKRSYLELIVYEMIASAYRANGSEALQLIGMNIRWKQKEAGKSVVDQLHIDNDASFTTSLSLLGRGTELFHRNENSISVTYAPTMSITHFLGGHSRQGVVHRSSIAADTKLSIILVWKQQ